MILFCRINIWSLVIDDDSSEDSQSFLDEEEIQEEGEEGNEENESEDDENRGYWKYHLLYISHYHYCFSIFLIELLYQNKNTCPNKSSIKIF